MCCQSLRKAMCESLRFFDHFKAFCFLTEVWVVYASACNMGCCQRSELWSLIFTSGITIRHVLSQSWSDWKVDVRCSLALLETVTLHLVVLFSCDTCFACSTSGTEILWRPGEIGHCRMCCYAVTKIDKMPETKFWPLLDPTCNIFRQTTTSTSHKPAPKSVLRVAKSIWACSAPADVSYCNLPRHLMDDLNLLGPIHRSLVPSRLRESGQAEYARVD